MYLNTRGSDRKQISTKAKMSSSVSLNETTRGDNFYNPGRKDISPSYKNSNISHNINNNSIRESDSYSQKSYMDKTKGNSSKSGISNNQGKKYFINEIILILIRSR